MVIDTSALIAVLQDEPERRRLNEAIDASEVRLLSAASLVESSIILATRHGGDGVRDLDLFLAEAAIEVIAIDKEQAMVARRAFTDFGKGRHRAGLNFGDCFSYALAKTSGRALLFKGDDFAHTDLAALPY